MTSSQLCSVKLSSSCFSLFQLWQRLLSSSHLLSGLSSSQVSQLFSTALKVVPSLPTSSSTLFTSSPALLNSSQRISPLPTLVLTLLNSSHLLSQRCLHTEQAFTRRSIYTQQAHHIREALTQLSSSSSHTLVKLLHTASFCREKLLHTASFRTASFYTEHSFTQRSFYTKQAFFTQQKLLHRGASH